jgi:hypothetical protein
MPKLNRNMPFVVWSIHSGIPHMQKMIPYTPCADCYMQAGVCSLPMLLMHMAIMQKQMKKNGWLMKDARLFFIGE